MGTDEVWKRTSAYTAARWSVRPEYAAAAKQLGQSLAHHGFGLVYGGGRVGLMGIVADAVLAAGGRVIGVIPEPLAFKEIAHAGSDRAARRAATCTSEGHDGQPLSAFLTLPGGIGTFEEFFETLTLGDARAARETDGSPQRRRLLRPLARPPRPAVCPSSSSARIHLELVLVSDGSARRSSAIS